MSIEELAILCKTDKSRISELWESVYRLIYMWALKYLPDNKNTSRYDIEDLTQNAYFALLQAIEDYPADSKHKFSTYLYNHCRNAFREILGIRSSKQELETISIDAIAKGTDDFTLLDSLEDEAATAEFDKVENTSFNDELRLCLEAALKTIPQEHQEVLQKRYFKNYTYEEIGKERGVSIEAARQLNQKAIQSMRRGKAIRLLHSFDYRCEGLKHTGLQLFKTTFTSSQERAVERKEDIMRYFNEQEQRQA